MKDNKKSLEEMIAETMKEKQEQKTSSSPGTDNSENNKEKLKFKYYDDNYEHHHHSNGEHHHSNSKKKSKKNKKAKIVAFSVIGIFLAFFLVVGGVFYHYISLINIKNSEDEILDSIEVDYTKADNSPQSEIDKLNAELQANFEKEGLLHSDKIKNILLLGTDSRDNDSRGRSDSMILLTINTVTKEINMTSLLRDMYVSIPGKENSRLNHAYAYGGATLTMKTIEQNFKFKIDNYVQINFYAFKEVIDAVDGVDIALTNEEVEYMKSVLNGSSPVSGNTYHLNGEQALVYSRIRYIGTDFGRTERQRNVLEKVIEKASKLSLSELDNFIDVFLPKLTTDLTVSKIASLLVKSPAYFKYPRNQYRVPIDDSWSYMTINHMSVLGVDIQKNKEYLFDKLYHYKENSKDNDKSIEIAQ